MLRATLEESDNSLRDESRTSIYPLHRSKKNRSSNHIQSLLEKIDANNTCALDPGQITLYESMRWAPKDQNFQKDVMINNDQTQLGEKHAMRFFDGSLMNQYYENSDLLIDARNGQETSLGISDLPSELFDITEISKLDNKARDDTFKKFNYEDDFLENSSINMDKLLRAPFEGSFNTSQIKDDNQFKEKKRLNEKSISKPICRLPTIFPKFNEFSPIKALVEYSSSENEDTFVKPLNNPIRNKKCLQITFDSFNRETTEQPTFEECKLQSTMINKSVALPQLSSIDGQDKRKIDQCLPDTKKKSKILVDNKKSTDFTNLHSKAEYGCLLDKQKLHLINLKKELLRVQRLERLFAKLSASESNVQKTVLNNQEQNERNKENQCQNQKNFLDNLKNKDEIPSDSSYVDLASSIGSSKASYESSDSFSCIRSILQHSSSEELDFDDEHKKNCNETFIKYTSNIEKSHDSSILDDSSGLFHLKNLNTSRINQAENLQIRNTLPNYENFQKKRTPNVCENQAEKPIDNFCNKVQENENLTLQQIFAANRPALYQKISKRAVQLSMEADKRRKSREIDNTQNLNSRPHTSTSISRIPCQITQTRTKLDLKDVRKQTAKKYAQLPEVVRRREEQKRQEMLRHNRMMAQAYKIQIKEKVLRRGQRAK